MAVKQFKAESKRLLDLMIHSIYTHKEIFLRELISNANDAIDKLHYRSLTDGQVKMRREDYAIELKADKEKRILTVSDNGCGMTKEELEKHLGTIADSGSFQFKQETSDKKTDGIDVIGQFGVGFYSAFMVADKVTVISKSYGADTAYKWESCGADGYTVEAAERNGFGTDVVLEIKKSDKDEDYDGFLDSWRLKELVKKYSDYIRYPIRMDVEKSRLKEGSDKEYEKYVENETLNSMVPIWKRAKKELKDEDYHTFYKEKFGDYEAPARVIHSSVEGVTSYNALLFVPKRAPFNYYTKDYEKGLQLYASGVLIMEKCKDLLPDYFSFVHGLVDSQDLSLNISREMLQHDRQLKLIESSLEKKIQSELLKMLESDRPAYEEFFKNFGLQLKAGVYSEYGAHKDFLQDLLLFYSSSEKKPVTLKEYVSRMKEEQKYIYYACGESVEKIDRLPQTELVKEKGYEALYLTDDIDEFVMKIIEEYGKKPFQSVSAKEFDLTSDEEKQTAKKQTEDNKELFALMKEALGDDVKEVKLSARMKSHAVCISAGGEISLEMEKVMNAMPNGGKIKAERVLELNPAHAVFPKLQKLFQENQEKLKEYTKLLYTQALLIEGLPVDDPAAFSDGICALMTE